MDFDNTPPAARDLSAPHDNTAPTAIALAAATPSNGEPESRDLATPHADAAPVSRDLSAPHEDDEPESIELGSPHDNTAPAEIALAGFTPSDDEPAASSPGDFSPVNEAPRYRGSLPLSTPTDHNVNTPILSLDGELVVDRIYGQTRITANSVLKVAQVALNDAPEGEDAIIELVDANGDSYGVEVTVPAGERFGETVLETPLPLLLAANIRAKCTQRGSANPGGFGIVTLFTQLSA